jgi:hypothetical protein
VGVTRRGALDREESLRAFQKEDCTWVMGYMGVDIGGIGCGEDWGSEVREGGHMRENGGGEVVLGIVL